MIQLLLRTMKKIYFSSYKKVTLFLNNSRGRKAAIWQGNGTHEAKPFDVLVKTGFGLTAQKSDHRKLSLMHVRSLVPGICTASGTSSVCMHVWEELYCAAEVVQKVNEMIATGQYGRLFAVVHFASKQWKVTSEDLIMMDNVLEAECGDRIRMEKVLLVGADDFTLIGRPLLGKDLVRVEATVIEKTESWPKINMRFWKRHNYQRKKIIRNPQAVLRINTIDIFPSLS
uniref:Large ribosomal subunit protein bL21m n=1 Tax=Apteryx owenii TaxID=8824 RepID=A0A8B9S7K0_APTOW